MRTVLFIQAYNIKHCALQKLYDIAFHRRNHDLKLMCFTLTLGSGMVHERKRKREKSLTYYHTCCSIALVLKMVNILYVKNLKL